jgi:hypothetical protein
MKAFHFLSVLALAAVAFCSCYELEGEGSEDEGNGEYLEKAIKLNSNTYVVKKAGGEGVTRNFVQKWSMWERMPMTDPETDQTTMMVNLSLEDADADGGTLGGAYMMVPESEIGKVIILNKEFLKANPQFHASAFTFKDPAAGHEAGEITAKLGMDQNGNPGGNISLEGDSQLKVVETKAFSGVYQVYFYFTFHNTLYVWNPDKGEYGEYDEIDDGDYVIYGNALINEYVPPVRTFTLKPHEFYLGYGGSGQVLDVEFEPVNAKWDWTDLEIASNSETFNYYPETHTISINTLAPYADSHVLGVQVKFWLKSNHDVYDFVYVNMNEQPRS